MALCLASDRCVFLGPNDYPNGDYLSMRGGEDKFLHAGPPAMTLSQCAITVFR